VKKSKLFLISLVLSIGIFSTSSFADTYQENGLLNYGISGNEVNELQNDLKVLGYFNQNITNYFGNETKEAVMKFQKTNNLVPDGIVGELTSREIKIELIIKTAKECLGIPYVWGGVNKQGFDCSGFTQYVLRKNDVNVSRIAETQYLEGTWIPKSKLKAGDLIFFQTYKLGPSHVGIYLDNGMFIHASSGKNEVTISKLDNTYYTQHYLGAKRII
jgi:cell wall-associated NlpC family hydrolase